jgi:hypothetical protein
MREPEGLIDRIVTSFPFAIIFVGLVIFGAGLSLYLNWPKYPTKPPGIEPEDEADARAIAGLVRECHGHKFTCGYWLDAGFAYDITCNCEDGPRK